MKHIFLIFILLISKIMVAQVNTTYQKPSAGILALADYVRPPSANMDTRKEYMLLLYSKTFKSLNELSQEELRLGGIRVNPVTHIALSTNYFYNIKVRKVKDTGSEPVQVSGLPQDVKIANISWSPDDSKVAFTHISAKGVELWVIDVATAAAKKLTEANMNCTLGNPFVWYSDSRRLLVKLLPSTSSPLIESGKEIPSGPIVSVSGGKVSQNRTYQDLLKNKTDEQNFETLITSEIQIVTVEGALMPFKGKGAYSWLSFSPDGNLVMITSVQKPYSYIVPYERFPQQTTVFDLSGREIKVVNEVPLTEILPKGFSAVRGGKRNMGWRDDQPATLYYVEALDGGDPARKTDFRDEIFTWEFPFTAEPKSIGKTSLRFSNIIWGDDQTAIVTDNWDETRMTNIYLINPSLPQDKPKVLFSRNVQDVYNDPGRFETRENQFARRILAIENGNLFLIGDGFSPEGQFPFIDEFNLKSLKTKRLYQSAITGTKEDIVNITDFKKGIALVQLQSAIVYPNYFFRYYQQKEKLEQLTFNVSPFESLKNVEKTVIKYLRDDGVELSGTLYLPPGYDKTKKEKLPLLIWAYPVEFKDKNSAGQNTQNPNEFTFPNYGSFILYVVNGYAILDDASFPIVGEGENEPNDSFIQQLVANGKAALDAVDKLGYIDRNKVAVGGHSYGAFMTANLLTHSGYFTCGIARSGAYNRTLTPFGFQREARNYWDAPEVYDAMSPFQNADKMKNPILLVHGEADNNPGTFTLQTERYFQALKGLGADARMVILPKESHGYAARENILHLLWEQEQFLDKYLKNNK
jgi:dipeptidyl aminopeptidase/acylaminoacyl peptidase